MLWHLPSRPIRRSVPLAAAALALSLAVPAPHAAASDRAPRDPDHLVIVSSTDVKGQTSPCGCHIPKGGFSRRAGLVDSLRARHDLLLLVDSGGWFPDGDPAYHEAAEFQAAELVRAGTQVVGVADRELGFGVAYLRDLVQRSALPATCANLFERDGKHTVLPPWRLLPMGRAQVGVFALMLDNLELGLTADSIVVTEPVATARLSVADLRQHGATVVVLLSNLGKAETESLLVKVKGIDAAIVGHNVPTLEHGRRVGNTVAGYGGEQGHFAGETTLTLDDSGHVTAGDNVTVMLGPDIEDVPEVLARVKAFQDGFQSRLHERDKERAAAAAAALAESENAPPDSVPHYIGASKCGRCHGAEQAQWQGSPHANAWRALVNVKADARPQCFGCHVTGFAKPGGFATAVDADRLGGVQCESCHGMGTEHVAFPSTPARVAAAACTGCHTPATSPGFALGTYRPHVLHDTQAQLPDLPPAAKHY